MKRFFVVTTLALVIGALALVAWILLSPPSLPSPGSIATRGGEKLDLLLTEKEPHHCQSDPAWARETIGGSEESIGAVGCTLCCVSMAFNHFGITTEPNLLNDSLIENGGYTERGWIRWDAVRIASDNEIEVVVHQVPSHSRIDDDLKAGRLVLAKFMLPLGIPHWVLICGKSGDDYLVKDPAIKTPGLLPLSRRANAIVSIRTIQRRA